MSDKPSIGDYCKVRVVDPPYVAWGRLVSLTPRHVIRLVGDSEWQSSALFCRYTASPSQVARIACKPSSEMISGETNSEKVNPGLKQGDSVCRKPKTQDQRNPLELSSARVYPRMVADVDIIWDYVMEIAPQREIVCQSQDFIALSKEESQQLIRMRLEEGKEGSRSKGSKKHSRKSRRLWNFLKSHILKKREPKDPTG